MAHTCPDCEALCHCGGDVGDVILVDAEQQANCVHECDDDLDDDVDFDVDDDLEDDLDDDFDEDDEEK